MKTETIVLIAAGGYIAYTMLKKPAPASTLGGSIDSLIQSAGLNPSAINNLISTSFAAGDQGSGGGRSVPLSANDLNQPIAPIVVQEPLQFSLTTPAPGSDNPLITHVDYSGATPPGIPAIDPSFANNGIVVPTSMVPLGTPPTAIQDVQGWQEGGPAYIGANPMPVYLPPPPTPTIGISYPVNGAAFGGLERVNPDYQLAPFEYFRTDDQGNRFVVSALSGQDIKYLEWARD